MADDTSELLSSPPVVAIAGWLLPGAGYLFIGELARGITIGVTIIALFVAGLLIAGVRVIEVPGYDVMTGAPIPLNGQWIMKEAPLAEIRSKLWSVPQALAGPIDIAAAAASVHAAQPDPNHPGHSIGELVHARVDEIGALYLSVAGLLNLMAIIDAAWRASNRAEGTRCCKGGRIMTLLAYRPFLDPMPIWDYWFVLIVPLCVAVSVVYKSIKCRYMSQVPWEASVILIWIIGGFAAAAAVLMLLVKWLAQ